MTIYFFLGCFIVRLITLLRSIKNEKRLRVNGAIEYGKRNSKLLTLVHVLFYASCIYEGLLIEVAWETYIGLAFFVFSMLTLWYVIFSLGEIWTVKLFISRNHKLNKGWLFRTVKHPNYFLSIIPELIGITLICNAWYTFLVGFPFYMVLLMIRIIEEEKVMKQAFKDY